MNSLILFGDIYFTNTAPTTQEEIDKIPVDRGIVYFYNCIDMDPSLYETRVTVIDEYGVEREYIDYKKLLNILNIPYTVSADCYTIWRSSNGELIYNPHNETHSSTETFQINSNNSAI